MSRDRMTKAAMMNNDTVSAEEIAKFDRLASRWWNPGGPMAPLHQMNPTRVAWIEGLIGDAFRRSTRILDVGCGGGLAAEALAKLGHKVLGIDAAGEAIAVAKAHAGERHPSLSYRTGLAEDLLAEGLSFPVITALEVIEHVPDPAAFIRLLSALLEPGGLLVISTLNRTRKSWVVAKLGAEYVLRMLPVGTHQWKAFITPVELAGLMRAAGLRVGQTAGLLADPLSGQWRIGRDMSVNYMLSATR